MSKKRLIIGAVLLTALASGPLAQANADKAKFDKNMTEQSKTGDKSAASQKKIDSVASETKEILDGYRSTLRKIENTKAYNQQMRELIKSQNEEMTSIKTQIESLKRTNKEILPLMARMAGTFEKFVELDVPFLPEERNKRVTTLKAMLKRADVSTSEKFRRIMEAYQVEAEYGRTIEAYRAIHKEGSKETTVDFLRVGRVALMYQTLDGKDSYVWDQAQKKWSELPGEYNSTIKKGLRIARKQVAPDLIKLPIQAPEVIQ